MSEIAKRRGVAHILEGTVQKSTDQVRVNVQLINAQTDSHLWAEKFDRKLTDIFAVESEIAAKIADTLQAKLNGAEQRAIATRPTDNSEAHQLYLKGRFYWDKSLPFDNLSSDKDNAYFADGVQGEILTDLAKIADLKVISRSSVMHYKSGVGRNLRKIGE
ncbi:MAG: hypothetical protein DLM52_07615 [Chthoniobacterales bacterium]|nr:MAG: hypothetical protein DLM52_07615 [Chthoniobacterales bacterium]